jgi:pilus assembly protein CpaE
MFAEISHLLAENLPFSHVQELREYPTRVVLAETLQQHTPTLCFVDVTSNRDWAISLMGDLNAMDPKLPIVALHQDNDSDYILRSLRQGATEFLLQPMTSDQFGAVMSRISSMYRHRVGEGAKLYCVMPAKGACGASTIATNLAYHLRRISGKKVLLADMDPLAGTVSFQLKLNNGYSFMDAINRGKTLDEDVWRGLVCSMQGLDVLLAPEKPVHGIDELQDATAILDFARIMYDIVVVDCNGAYGQWCLTLARLCDELLLTTTNELPALQAAQRSLAYLKRNRVDKSKTKVLVNRYNKDIGLSREVIETALHTEVYHLIPSDYEDVQKALVEGRPMASSTPIGKSLLQLSERLLGTESTVAAQPKTSSLSSLFSFLRR